MSRYSKVIALISNDLMTKFTQFITNQTIFMLDYVFYLLIIITIIHSSLSED